MSRDVYREPLVSRYTSPKMQEIFSERTKFTTWRRCWIALAEAQSELGLDNIVTRKAIEEMKAHAEDINFEVAEKKERELRLTSRQIVLISILFLIFMGSGIGYVWSNFEGTQIGYDLSRLQKREMELMELHRKLKLELAFLTSPQYLEDAAQKAGLRPAEPDQVILIQ